MYKLGRQDNHLTKLVKTSFHSEGFLERFHIEAWIAGAPDVLGEDLLVLATEHVLPSGLRIDILALDANANLVIVELKRDWSGSEVDWQAIKYASYCSGLNSNDICGLLSVHKETSVAGARELIEGFVDKEIAGDDLEGLKQDQRIILVAGDFHSDIISSALWLREHSIDLRCVRLRCFAEGDNNTFFIDPEVIIPFPEAADYVKRKEAKDQRERNTERSTFSTEVENLTNEELAKLLRATLNRVSDLTPRFKAFLEVLLSEDRPFGREEIKQALLKRGVGKDIGRAGTSLSNLSQFITKRTNPHLRQLVAFEGGALPGQIKDNYRLVPQYRDLVREVLAGSDHSSNDSVVNPK